MEGQFASVANGLDAPFGLLFGPDEAALPSLPEPFRAVYPGDWHTRQPGQRPYIYSNFAQSRDGRISFNEPGMQDASHVTKAFPHDRWLMGLLRCRADAILVGDRTVQLETGHVWTAEFIYPPAAPAFAALRRAEGYGPVPKLVILSFSGDLDFAEERFQNPALHILLATTTAGVARAQASGLAQQCAAQVDMLGLGEDAVDLTALARLLRAEYSIRHLLCEGGANVFANLLDAGLIDEEFVTLCPTFVGRSPGQFRPSYTEGVAWLPETAPYSQPLALHRAGDYLFLRTRCRYPNRSQNRQEKTK